MRNIVKEKYKNEEKKDNKIVKRKEGGVFPLVPIGIAIASALGSKFAGDLYDWVRSRIVGSGQKIKTHKTIKDKKDFLKEIVNNLK